MDDIRTAHEVAASPAAIAATLAHEHVADIAERLNEETPQRAAQILAHLPPERAVEVLDQPELDASAELIEALPEDQVVAMLAAMSADRLAEVFRQMEPPARAELRGLLDAETRGHLDHLLTYPPNTAGALMTTEFVSVPADWTVARTLDHIRVVERTRETVYAIYVLDPERQTLLRAVPLRRLISGAPEASILDAAPARPPIAATPLMDREEVARLISKYNMLAVPVVDEAGHVLGIVTVDDVIDAIIAETTEDVHKFGGVGALDEPYMELGFGQMLRKRAGWLSALFIGEMLTASAMQHFEVELDKAVMLSLFIPLIMSSGGNSGSQATSLLIRALALRDVRLADWWRVALRELPTGLCLGAVLGLVGIARIALWQYAGLYDYGPHWHLIAATVGAALVGIVAFGSLAGSMLPFGLQRIGLDPASASAPLVATLVDVTGLVIYFTIALLILRGTLL